MPHEPVACLNASLTYHSVTVTVNGLHQCTQHPEAVTAPTPHQPCCLAIAQPTTTQATSGQQCMLLGAAGYRTHWRICAEHLGLVKCKQVQQARRLLLYIPECDSCYQQASHNRCKVTKVCHWTVRSQCHMSPAETRDYARMTQYHLHAAAVRSGQHTVCTHTEHANASCSAVQAAEAAGLCIQLQSPQLVCCQLQAALHTYIKTSSPLVMPLFSGPHESSGCNQHALKSTRSHTAVPGIQCSVHKQLYALRRHNSVLCARMTQIQISPALLQLRTGSCCLQWCELRLLSLRC
jgi:hypothetical protein